jgi:hypothetical protein
LTVAESDYGHDPASPQVVPFRQHYAQVRPNKCAFGGGQFLVNSRSSAGRAQHSEITRRHYVERSVTVPDYTDALDEYSRPNRALQAVEHEQAG